MELKTSRTPYFVKTNCCKRLEMPGIEPGASHMRSERSTTEPHPLILCRQRQPSKHEVQVHMCTCCYCTKQGHVDFSLPSVQFQVSWVYERVVYTFCSLLTYSVQGSLHFFKKEKYWIPWCGVHERIVSTRCFRCPNTSKEMFI